MKYKNKKVQYDGMTFDSKKELSRYKELKTLEQTNVISGLVCQERFLLIDKQPLDRPRKSGKRFIRNEKAVHYVADFVYIVNKTGEQVVEDTKGFKTADYIIKRKLMKKVHGIEIVEI